MMAASGSGVAILPEPYARRQARDSTEVVIRPLALAEATRVIALLQPADSPALPGTELLSGALRRELRRVGLAPEGATV
jgi:LysR family hydrogen peroxide-inducible transcriptional activator